MSKRQLTKGCILLGIWIFLWPGNAQSQTGTVMSFSLAEAREYAVLNSYKTRQSALDVEYARKQVKNYTSVGLPQISAKGGLNYYVDVPTQLMPNFMTPAVDAVLMQHGLISPADMLPAGNEKFEVQFGSKYNVSGDISLSQLIFDGTYIVGLQTAKVYVEMTRTSHVKSQQEIRETVTQAYYLAQLARENSRILDSTVAIMRVTLEHTKEYYKNGFIESTDVDQLQLLLSNLENKQSMVNRQIGIADDLLKFQMGIPIIDSIILTDPVEELLNQAIAANLINSDFNPQHHIDYQLMETSNHISQLQHKMDKYKYMPTLIGFGTLSYSAQRDKFNFFKSGSDYPWYRTTLVGISLSVPIWSSGSRHYQIKMSKFTLQKNDILLNQLEEALSLDVKNARSSLKTYTDQYETEVKNLDLAGSIYRKTLIKYREGVSSSLELTQAHNQYLSTQGNYMNTLLELLNANSRLNKALNKY